ncbi:MAG: DUF3794 domain-containing protein [Clostridia bacterium]|nr:DUF3794 domain-containing protein [Clostridia bacterium]MBQ7289081.1 DUF3794 domain-containing protein [Clostridia bacterium]
MEIAVMKEKVNTKRALMEKNFEQPMEMSINLPEYYPDIEKILSCKAETFVVSKAVEGNTLILNGTNSALLIYRDAEGQINSFTTAVPFTKKIELNLTEQSYMISAKPAIAYFNYKASSPKKVNVRGAINILLEIFAKDTIEILADAEEPTLETMHETMQGMRFFGNTEQNVFIEEEQVIENTKPPIKCILKVVKDCKVDSCKVISNKVIVKGLLSCRVIYCTTEEEIEELQVEIPFNQILDFDGLNDTCVCVADVELCSFDITPKTNYEGETRTLVLTATACVKVEAYLGSEIKYISDAYSTKYEMKMNKKEMAFREFLEEMEERFVCKKEIDYPDEIMDIENCWGEIMNLSVKTEGTEAQISGNLLICALVRDGNKQCKIIERTIDFNWAKALNREDAMEYKICANAYVSNIRCNLSNNGVEVHVELKITCRIFRDRSIECLDILELCEDNPIKNTDSIGAVLYFAKNGDRVWNIAKEHHTAKALVMECNALEEDVIHEDMALMLPIL